ncbi:MAG: hypothetical protein M3140_06460 [Actinomycetota bacterium]|nr:hypothetical protein [Actinomycetota bacterium]
MTEGRNHDAAGTQEPVPHVYFLDPRDSRPVNPNTPEGEIRNMAAFAAGVHSLPPGRRAATKVLVWLVLIGIALGLLAGVIEAFRAF